MNRIIKPYLNNQSFTEIKKKCLQNGSLFVDSEFPANLRSLAKFNNPSSKTTIYWKRPNDLVSNPQLFVNGPNPNDLDQGEIGDCWFIAGAVAISQYPEYFNLVVLNDQSFENGDYFGGFHFRFWRYGEWVDVIVDDFLPVDSNNRLIYCRNKSVNNEFWCSLIEKAYAKLNTCYEFLDGGLTQDSLIDMTGGVEEIINLKEIDYKDRDKLWKSIKKSVEMKSLGGASFNQKETINKKEMIRDNGLVANHAYTITNSIEIESDDYYYKSTSSYYTNSDVGKICLIRLRNPWGDDHEWNGRFSDSSSEWLKLSESIREEIGLVIEKDGEFWMPFDDFIENFETLIFVHVDMNLSYESTNSENRKSFKWNSKRFDGKLERNDQSIISNANSQFMITINDVDKEDNDDTATLIVSLIQKDSIKKRNKNNGQCTQEAIHFDVYRPYKQILAIQSISSRSKFNLRDLEKIADSGPYTPSRSITKRFKLQPGTYVIIPSSYYDVEVNFLLRLFTEMEIADEDLSYLDKPVFDDQFYQNNKKEPIGHNDYEENPLFNNTYFGFNTYGFNINESNINKVPTNDFDRNIGFENFENEWRLKNSYVGHSNGFSQEASVGWNYSLYTNEFKDSWPYSFPYPTSKLNSLENHCDHVDNFDNATNKPPLLCLDTNCKFHSTKDKCVMM